MNQSNSNQSYCQTRVNTFSGSSQQTLLALQGVTPKRYHKFFQISSSTDIFREFLSDNTTHFSKAYINQYWHFQSYWQTISHTFPELTSSNTDIFRELLANNITHFSRPGLIPSNTDIFREFLPNLSIVKGFFRVHITQY